MAKNVILLHQGIVRSLILYIDFHVVMFLKEMCIHVGITITGFATHTARALCVIPDRRDMSLKRQTACHTGVCVQPDPPPPP